MQPVTAPPRQALTTSIVLGLLTQSPSVQIKGGVERLDASLTLLADLSANLQSGSSVQSDCAATIHRSCTLVMDANTPFNYLSEYLKPYIILTDNSTGVTARFNLGVYQMASPTPDLTLSPGQSSYTGYDLLQVLNQPIGNAVEVAAGADPIATVKGLVSAAFPAATYAATATTTTLPALSYPLDSNGQFTYLDVVNSLLSTVGYAPIWVDWDGNFRINPYVDPNDTSVAAEWTFDLTTAAGSVTAAGRSMYQDLYNVPNTWVNVMNNLPGAPVEGVTQFTFTDNWSIATSVPARGRVVKVVRFFDAADYPSLVVAAAQQIEQDLLTTETFAISTFPIPLFWHRDTVVYTDPVLATIGPLYFNTRRTMVLGWSLPLDANSGDMGLTLITTSAATSKALGH